MEDTLELEPLPAQEPTPVENDWELVAAKSRVRLVFDRNKDLRTEYYYIYRSTLPGVSRRDVRIMKVRHPKLPNPIEIKDDTASLISDMVYQLSHAGLFPDRDVSIYVDGVKAEAHEYVLDYEDGVIRFGELTEVKPVITADYTFDGIEVIDDPKEQTLVEAYYGPYAYDISSPLPPKNLMMVADKSEGSLTLSYQPGETIGQDFYYCIEARGTRQNWSELSGEYRVHLTAHMAEYQIEASVNGTKWLAVAYTDQLSWTDYDADKEPPEPLQSAEATVTPVQNTGKADIRFTWNIPLLNSKRSYSLLYRVRSKTDAGMLSEPTVSVGPEILRSDLDRIVIRRKVFDGISFPTYNGPDAVTAAEITDLSVNTFNEQVVDDTTYSYSLFVVDKSGNVSPAVTFTLIVANTTAPGTVAGVIIEPHNFII